MIEDKYAEIYDLYVIKELSSREVGKILNISSHTVLSRLAKAGIKARPKNRYKKRIIKSYGELIPIEYKYSSRKSAYWLFQCSCGKTCVKQFSSVESGLTKSCGHLRSGTGSKNPNYKGYNNIGLDYFNTVKRGAKARALEFSITIEDMDNQFEAQNGKCFYSNLNLECAGKYNYIITQTASLDRIDSSKGYTVDNIKWVHKDINFMKGSLSHEKFVDWCNMISLNMLDECKYPF